MTEIESLTESLHAAIMRQRDAIVTAFIAETGFKPSECEQVSQGDRWFVRRLRPIVCGWKLDEDDGSWDASCGLKWLLEESSDLADHEMNFCPKCGAKIEVKP